MVALLGPHSVCWAVFWPEGYPQRSSALCKVTQQVVASCQGGSELQTERQWGWIHVLLLQGLLICVGVAVGGGLPSLVAAEGSGYCCLSAQTGRPPPWPYAKASQGQQRTVEDGRARRRLLGRLALIGMRRGLCHCLGLALLGGPATENL